MQSQQLGAWKLELPTSHRVTRPKYDMDAYMEYGLGGKAQDLCRESDRAKS